MDGWKRCDVVMINQTASEKSNAVVDAYYQAGVRGRLTEFAPYLHPDFSTTAPNYLPGAACIREQPSSATPNCSVQSVGLSAR
jgi:hypothetical protein